MSIATTTRQIYIAAGDGSTTVHAYTWKIDAATELEIVKAVITTGVETTLIYLTDYTVSGVGVSTGGNVTLTTALATTERAIIRGKIALTQTADIRNQGEFLPETHEDAFDRRVMADQQQQKEIDRSFKLPVTVNPASHTTEVVPTASTYLAFDASGNLTTVANLTAYTVTPFAATLLDDTTAAAARTTLDCAQKTSSLTAETTPAVGDYVSIIDVSESATAENKMLLSDLFKVIGGLDINSAADLSVADAVASYRNDTGTAQRIPIPNLVSAAIGRPGFTHNIGLKAATTTDANDSIQLVGANGSVLAAITNLGYVTIPDSATSGKITRLQATALSALKLTGAHWGRGTFGNWTDIPLGVYVVNDGSGTFKFGVCAKPNLRTIADSNAHTTATSVTTYSKMLVTSALASGTWPCVMIGWFLGDFNDTGDVWTVQTAAGEINVGVEFPEPTGSVIRHTVTAGAHGSGSTKVRRLTTQEVADSKAVHDNGADATLGCVFTVLEDGKYAIDYSDNRAAGSGYMGISVDSNQLTTGVESITAAHLKAFCTSGAANEYGFVSVAINLTAGQAVRPHTGGNMDGTGNLNRFSIRKIAHA